MNKTETPPPKRSLAAKLLRPKVAIPVMLVLGLLLTPMVIRQWNLRGVPDVGEPYDLAEFEVAEVADEDNAWIGFAAAHSLHIDASDPVVWEVIKSGNFNEIVASREVAQWIRDNDIFLEEWRAASERPKCRMVPLHPQGMASQAEYFEWHMLVLLAKGLLVTREQGPCAAWPWYRALLRSAVHLSTQTQELYNYDVSREIFELAFYVIAEWSASPELTAEQLLTARRELEEAWATTGSMSRGLKSYCRWHHGYLEELIELDRARETFLDRFKRYLAAEPELSRRIVNVHYTNLIAAVDLPRHQLRPETGPDDLPAITDASGSLVGVSELDSSTYFAAFQRSLLFKTKGVFPDQHIAQLEYVPTLKAQYQSLRTVLTLQAFYRDHHNFPGELAKLVPVYLTEIPLDPYTNKPLRYRLDDRRAIVYSVHKNKIDDGGMYYAPYRIKTHFRSPPSTVVGNPNDVGFLAYIGEAQPLIAPKP